MPKNKIDLCKTLLLAYSSHFGAAKMKPELMDIWMESMLKLDEGAVTWAFKELIRERDNRQPFSIQHLKDKCSSWMANKGAPPETGKKVMPQGVPCPAWVKDYQEAEKACKAGKMDADAWFNYVVHIMGDTYKKDAILRQQVASRREDLRKMQETNQGAGNVALGHPQEAVGKMPERGK